MLEQGSADAQVRGDRALALTCLGRGDDLEDLGAEAGSSWVRALAMRGRFDDAYRHAATLEDRYLQVYCLRAAQRLEQARDLARRATRDGAAQRDPLRAAYLHAAAGDREAAASALESHGDRWLPLDLWDLARIHCLLGNRDEALRILTRAVDTGLRLPAGVSVDPDLAPIAEDSRFRTLVPRARGARPR